MPADITSVPTEPAEYTASLYVAAKSMKRDLSVMRRDGTDIGKGQKVRKAHIYQWGTPWSTNVREDFEGTNTIHDFIADTVERLRRALTDPGAPHQAPFDMQKLPAKAKECERLMMYWATQLVRFGVGAITGIRYHGDPITEDKLLGLVRDDLRRITETDPRLKVKRRFRVTTPGLPIWNKSAVTTFPDEKGDPLAFSLLKGTVPEEKFASWLSGPDLRNDPAFVPCRATDIARFAVPELLHPNTSYLEWVHPEERQKLRELIENVTDWTPELRIQAMELILNMLGGHEQFGEEAFELLMADIARLEAGGDEERATEIFAAMPSITGRDADAILDRFIVTPFFGQTPLNSAEGRKLVEQHIDELTHRLPIIVYHFATLVHTAQSDPSQEANMKKQLVGLITLIGEIIRANANPDVFSTLAQMMAIAYADKDPAVLKQFV